MSIRHPHTIEWEDKLKQVFDRIDDALEIKYGSQFPLHPRRPERGTTSNKEHDGLFNIGASFALGYGSRKGKGYIVDVRVATLEQVPDEVMTDIEADVIKLLKGELVKEFPGRQLNVEKEDNIIKITGDLSLGNTHNERS